MYILHIIPIERGVFLPSLEYFSSDKVEVGSIVEVPLRNRQIRGLVSEITNAKDEKTLIKSRSFSIRKVSGLKSEPLFDTHTIKMINKLSEYYVGTPGAVLAHLSPKPILENLHKISIKKRKKARAAKKSKVSWEGPLVVQAPDDERLVFYKTRIREEFALKSSVFLVMPTVVDIQKISESFGKGIGRYTIVLHSGVGRAELLARWERALNEEHPVLIVGTGSFITIPRHDISTFILDRENTSGYKLQTRPYTDIRDAVRALAESRRLQLVIGDSILRTETIYEKESGKCHPRSNVKYRTLNNQTNIVIDMNRVENEPFTTLSEDLKDLILKTIDKNEQTFLFVHRRGLATSTICNDCGHILTCHRCSAPLVLHGKKARTFKIGTSSISGENIYVCNKCSRVRDSHTLCDNCGSWQLVPLGIGLEKVEEEIKEEFPKLKIFRLESDNIKSFKQGRKLIDKFQKTPGSVLLGTEMALLYLDKKIDNVAVTSFDSIFTLPDYRIRERAFNILLRLKHLASHTYMIQTRLPDTEVYEYAKRGNIVDFFRDEIEVRRKYKYPPFGVLIKVTREDTSERAKRDIENLSDKLVQYKPFVYPAFVKRVRNKERVNLLIRVKSDSWPDKKLLSILNEVGPEFLIDVNPKEVF